MANVTYFQLKDGKVFDKRTYICFAPMIGNWKNPDLVRYVAPIKNLKHEAIVFYLDFLENILGKHVFIHKFVKWHGEDCILYETNTKGMDRYRALMIFTAQRYITEYPHLVKQLYEESQKVKQFRAKFKKFMDIHKRNGVGNGHSLTYAYNPNINLVGYEEFRKRIEGEVKIGSVHDYFSSKEPPKPPKPERIYNLKERELEYFWGDVKRY